MSSKIVEFNPVAPPELAKDSDGNATTKGEAYTFDVPSIVTSPIKVTAPDGSYFSWQPAELCYKDESGQIDYIVGSSPSTINIFKNQAKYSRTFPLSDDIFNAEADRVKHWTILNEKPRDPAEYLTGKIVFGVSGLITGTPVPPGIHECIKSGMFNLPKPVIKDLSGKEIDGYYEVMDTDDGQQLFIWFDNEFLNNAIYPVTIDPTVIVASLYTPVKTLKLDNGWIVCLILDGPDCKTYAYVSKDNGSTWAQMFYISGGINSVNMCNVENMLYIAGTISTSGLIYFWKIDATTISNVDLLTLPYTSKSGLQAIMTGINIAVNGTNVYLVYSTRTDSDHKYGAFVLISTDGGATFGSQITLLYGTSYNSYINDVIINSAGYPVILVNYSSFIYAYIYNGSSFTQYTVLSLSNIGNAHICKTTDGILHVIVDYYYSTTGSYELAYTYSTDNGVTWQPYAKITSFGAGIAEPHSISYDPDNNNLYVFLYYASGGNDNIYHIDRISGVWGSPANITNLSTGVARYPKSMKIKTDNIIGFMYENDPTSSILFDKLIFNSAPNAPILNSKSNFDATKIAELDWTYSDPDSGDAQSAYELVIIKVSDGTTALDTGKVVNTSSLYNLPANTLANGTDYQWKVKTWDSSDTEGPYSSLGTFTCAAAPTATITSPSSDGSTITASKITTGWNFNDSESGRTQGKYQVRLTDSSDNELWSSGQVSDATARALTCNYTLANNASYKIKIIVWNDLGIQSDEAVRTFTVSFTPPAIPTITAIADNDICSITINITNPVPSGSEPNVSGNDIYRDGIRIASSVSNQYVDYAAEPFTQHEYKAIALGDNGTVSESSAVKASASITDVQLMLVSNPAKYVKLKYNPSKEEKSGPEGELMQFSGRKLPVAEFDDSDNQNINCSFTILDKPDLNILQQLADSKQTLLYRDSRGRKIYCTINDGISTKDELPDYWTVSFIINAISYDEEV